MAFSEWQLWLHGSDRDIQLDGGSLLRGNSDEALECAMHLADWLHRGGFPPVLHVSTDGMQVFVVDERLAREICRASCRLVLDQHEAGCDPVP